MSIFASLAAPDGDEHLDSCARWAKTDDASWEISNRPCDCGQPDAPLVYQGSHVLPDERTDPRSGWVDLALIPSHITRDGRDDKPEDDMPWPYLRFGVNGETVILTRHHVEQIVRRLSWWLGALDGEGGS